MCTRAQPSEYTNLLTDFFPRLRITFESAIIIRLEEKSKQSMILHISNIFLVLSTIQKKKRKAISLALVNSFYVDK